MGELFGELRGGLGISTIIVATLLAASTGIVGATVVTMGIISLPAMLKAGYDKRLSSGLICASGTLCQIIPPSTILVFLAVILQSAHSQAQMAKGNFNPTTLSVGDLFAGAFIPGVMLAGLYIAWVVHQRDRAARRVRPRSSSRAEEKRGLGAPGGDRAAAAADADHVRCSAPSSPGVATPTEAASVGAVGAILLTLIKLSLRASGQGPAAGTVAARAVRFLARVLRRRCGAGRLHRRARGADAVRRWRLVGGVGVRDRDPGGPAPVLRHRRRGRPHEPGDDHHGVRDLHGRQRVLGGVHAARRRDPGRTSSW